MELAIAVLGVVLGAVSLGWQGATYVLSGGRVRVELRVGAMADNGRGMVTGPPSSMGREWRDDLAEQGYSRPVVAVRVANVGRMPVTVQGWSITSPRGPSLSTVGGVLGPALPYRLDAGSSETWAMALGDIQRFAEAVKVLPEARRTGGLGSPPLRSDDLRAMVELGDGRTSRSRNVLPMGS